MHEVSLAIGVIKVVEDSLKNHKVKKISEIDVEVGEFNFVTPSEMKHAFKIASQGTRLEKVKLNVKMKKGKGKCLSCGYKGGIKLKHGHGHEHEHEHNISQLQCPKCKEFSVKILEGRDIKVKRIKAEVEE